MKKRDFLKSLLLPFFIIKKEKNVYTVGIIMDNLQPLHPGEMYPTPTIEKKNIPSVSVSQFVYDPSQVSQTVSPSVTPSITKSGNPSISITRLPYMGGIYMAEDICPLK